jgi:hypothetical protein
MPFLESVLGIKKTGQPVKRAKTDEEHEAGTTKTKRSQTGEAPPADFENMADKVFGFDSSKQLAYYLQDGAPVYCSGFAKMANALLVTATWKDASGTLLCEWEVDCLTDIPGQH